VTAKGVATLYGRNGVTIASAVDEHGSSAGGAKSGFLSSKSFSYTQGTTKNLASVVSAGTLNVYSQGDIDILASHLTAKGDLTVLAGYDEKGKKVKGASEASVNVLSGLDREGAAYSQTKKGFGLFVTGGGVDVYRSTRPNGAALSVGGSSGLSSEAWRRIAREPQDIRLL
jgi:hypothetical protein